MANILLIETDRLLAKNLSKYLTKFGHEVSWHVEPQAAMDSADQKCPDVIVLDLLLANSRSGIEFLYEFRSYPEWQHHQSVPSAHKCLALLVGPV
jgi:DNA-binding response OmpR family regulator